MRRITHITCSEWKETSLNVVGSWDCQAQGPPPHARGQEGEVWGVLGWTRDGKGSLAQDQLPLGLP